MSNSISTWSHRYQPEMDNNNYPGILTIDNGNWGETQRTLFTS